MCKPSQNCCTCFDFTKMAPKTIIIIFFWKSCINLVVFGQLKGNWGSFDEIWAKMVLKLPRFENNAPSEMQSFFLWRSFSLDSFSGTFAEIWAKIIRTTKILPAPTPMRQRQGVE